MNIRFLHKYRLLVFTLLLALAVSLPAVLASAATPKNKLVTTEEGTYYYDKSGNIVKKKFVTLNSGTYYFASNGKMKAGTLFTVKNKTYYATKKGPIAKNRFVTIDGKRYYFNKKGVRETGWITYKEKLYYCPESGKIYPEGWKKISGYYYYFTSGGYVKRNTWVDGYYVNHKGRRTGEQLKTTTSSSVTKKVIKMKNIKQYPQLPTGCESVALTMVLKYYGFSLSKTTIASKYLPKSSTNFVTAFCGSPFSSSGAGIYSPGLTKTANKFLKAKKSSKKAYDITGTSLKNLYPYIDAGIPVIVWNSMYMRTPYAVSSYYYGGKTWHFYRSEHCVVLCGYDKKTNKVLINDSLSGLVWRKVSSFERIYNKMGKMAIVIR